MSDTHDIDAADVTPQASPGEQLKREREAQGLSRDDVATALNLRPAVVVGLEEDRYDEVPIAAYRRGYLRAYARLLGIEERPILDAYTQRFGHEEPPQHTTPVQVTKPPSRLGAWLFKLVSLLVIAGLVGLTLLWWQSRGGSEPPTFGDNSPVAVDNLDGTPSVIEEPQASGDDGVARTLYRTVISTSANLNGTASRAAMSGHSSPPKSLTTASTMARLASSSATSRNSSGAFHSRRCPSRPLAVPWYSSSSLTCRCTDESS